MSRSLIKDLILLVRTPSVTSDSNAAAARLAARMLRRTGFKVAMQKMRAGGAVFYNVTGLKGGRGRPFMLCAHLDTVPPGGHERWTRTGGNPWKATQVGNVLYGLGAADDKASFVAMAQAGGRLKAGELRRPLLVLATFGEESGMGGAWLFRRAWKGPKPFAAIVGEPTSLAITYRHKGMGVVELTLKGSSPRMPSSPRMRGSKRIPAFAGMTKVFYGKQGHSSRPWLGDNALEKAMTFLRSSGARERTVARLEGGAAPNLIPGRAEVALTGPRPQRDKRLADVVRNSGGYPAALITAFDGAVKKALKGLVGQKDPSFHPSCITSNFGVARTQKGSLVLLYDFRLLPGQSVTAIERKIRGEIRRRLKAFPRFRFASAVERANPPLGGERRGPLVRFAAGVLKRNGVAPKLVTKPSCTEAGVYERWGVPAIIFGPGRAAGNIHAPNEKVDLCEVARAAALYEALVRAACSGAKPCF